MTTIPASEPSSWRAACPLARLTPERGVAALVEGHQVAIFLLASGEVLAVADRDPFSGADVISRGLVGCVAGRPTVASPLYKQRFDLLDGTCLDDPTVSLRTFATRVAGGWVQVGTR